MIEASQARPYPKPRNACTAKYAQNCGMFHRPAEANKSTANTVARIAGTKGLRIARSFGFIAEVTQSLRHPRLPKLRKLLTQDCERRKPRTLPAYAKVGLSKPFCIREARET